MKKVWTILFVIIFMAWAFVILFSDKIGLSKEWMLAIQIALWIGGIIAFVGTVTESSRTDGDLIAGAEDEDGLVFALKTPVDELVQKKKVSFNVLKDHK